MTKVLNPETGPLTARELIRILQKTPTDVRVTIELLSGSGATTCQLSGQVDLSSDEDEVWIWANLPEYCQVVSEELLEKTGFYAMRVSPVVPKRIQTNLFIGGHMDGKQLKLPPGSEHNGRVSFRSATAEGEFGHVIYRREAFGDDVTGFDVWVLEEMTSHSAMARLLKNYRPEPAVTP